MKKIIIILILICFCGYLIYRRNEQIIIEAMPKDNLIIFTQKDCPHCHEAMAYIDGTLRQQYPDLKVERLDVEASNNLTKLFVLAKKHQLNTKRLGTPVIFLNKRALVGWPNGQGQRLSDMVHAFYAKKSLTSQRK